MTRNQKKWFIQKPIGIFFLLLSYFLIKMASTGVTPEDKDISFVLVTIPLGLWALFTKNIFSVFN